MSPRLAPAAILVGFALAAGILQILATVTLGLARTEALARAAGEGAVYYLIGGATTAVGLLGAWFLRERPRVAITVFLGWHALVLWPLSRKMSGLGLAFHGEYVLHHFCALLAAAAALAVAHRWWRTKTLGAARLLPIATIVVGAVGMVLVHVLVQPGFALRFSPTVLRIATALVLLGPLVALATVWKSTPGSFRWVELALLVPIVVRIALAWPESLEGASVPDDGQTALMAAVVIAATVTFLGFRPALPLAVRILVITLSGLATAVIYLIYRQGFGELEDGIGGLAQSLFGFSLPYPSYVPVWKVGMVMLALFFIFTTIYSGLMSLDDRERGLGLGLLAVTGLGLSNPQLVLMAAAGHLLLIDTLTREAQSRPQSDPDLPIEAIFGAVAQQFGLPPPVVLENRWGAVVAVRGDVEGTTLDLRARPRRHGGWDLTLRSGMMGRGRADVELLPDASQGGIRPPHAISRTHRVRGSVRALEDRGDAPLDALAPFHEARIRFWSAGVEVEFGRHLTALEPDGLSMLVRALSRWPTTSEDP